MDRLHRNRFLLDTSYAVVSSYSFMKSRLHWHAFSNTSTQVLFVNCSLHFACSETTLPFNCTGVKLAWCLILVCMTFMSSNVDNCPSLPFVTFKHAFTPKTRRLHYIFFFCVNYGTYWIFMKETKCQAVGLVHSLPLSYKILISTGIAYRHMVLLICVQRKGW